MSKILFASLFVVLCVLVIAVTNTFTSASSAMMNKMNKNRPQLFRNSHHQNQQGSGSVPPPPTAAPSHASTKFASLNLLEKLEVALQNGDSAKFMSLLSDDFQGYFPVLYPRDRFVDKQTTAMIINEFTSTWGNIQIQQFLQTASNYTATGIWDVNGELSAASVNLNPTAQFYLDDILKFVLRTTPDGQLVSRLEFYQAPAEGFQQNATKIALTTRQFYDAFSNLDVAAAMAFFSPAATYVEYGFSQRSGVVCDYNCIQRDFQEAFGSIYNKKLVARNDANPAFVVFSKIATLRKQFFAIPNPSNVSQCGDTSMTLASDIIEFDDTYKIKSWTAYYDGLSQ